MQLPARRRVGAALCGLVAAGALVAACGGGGGAAVQNHGGHDALARANSTSTSTTTTSTTTVTLPACGSLRDPFDPSDTPPPAGSPALC
jgi:hypothetical protein